jgi:uncharacterized protein YndB with AHSA1/START domain
MDRTSRNSKVIPANKEKVYKAFTQKNALEFWLAPDNMVGKIHNFKLSIGEGYDMSLFYLDDGKGKTSGNEDRFSTKFIELTPYDRIVQTVKFDSDKKELAEEMRMEVSLKELDSDTTEVTILFRNIPEGIDPKDNEAGTEQSLKKLANYLSK